MRDEKKRGSRNAERGSKTVQRSAFSVQRLASSLIPHPSSLKVWYAIDVTLVPEAREAVEYALMEAGALGTEVTDEGGEFMCVSAYFDAVPEREELRAALLDALRIYDLPSSSVREMQLREVVDRDWLGEWKRNWQPMRGGGRFLIPPPWEESRGAGTRPVIRIGPSLA